MRTLILSRHLRAKDKTLGSLSVWEGILELAKMATLEFGELLPSGAYTSTWDDDSRTGPFMRVQHVALAANGVVAVDVPPGATMDRRVLIGRCHADVDTKGKFERLSSKHSMDLLLQFVPGDAKLYVFDTLA